MKLHEAVAKRCIPNKLKGYCIFSLNVQHPQSTLTTKLQPNLASLRQLWAMQLSNQNSKLPTANCHLDPFGVPVLSKGTCPTSHVRFSIHQAAGSTGMLEWLEVELLSKTWPLNNIISPCCVWSFNASQEHAIQSGTCWVTDHCHHTTYVECGSSSHNLCKVPLAFVIFIGLMWTLKQQMKMDDTKLRIPCRGTGQNALYFAATKQGVVAAVVCRP